MNTGNNTQLPLSLGLKDSAVFDSFWVGPNSDVVDYLRMLRGGIQEPIVYLWGAIGSGKSHLLQALCNNAGERSLAAVYLPMEMTRNFPVDSLNGLETVDLVCIDDVQMIAGQADWEDALSELLEGTRDHGGSLVITADKAPAELGMLTHLASRLVWGKALQLEPLSGEEKIEAVKLRTQRRGFTLTSDVARYLVRHYGQDMGELFEALNQIDKASIVAKRRVTIPFIRSVMSAASSAKKAS